MTIEISNYLVFNKISTNEKKKTQNNYFFIRCNIIIYQNGI